MPENSCIQELNQNEAPNNCASCSKQADYQSNEVEDLADNSKKLERLIRKARIAQEMLNDVMAQLTTTAVNRKGSQNNAQLHGRCLRKPRHGHHMKRHHHHSKFSSNSSSDTSDNDCELVLYQKMGKDIDSIVGGGDRHGHSGRGVRKDRRRDRSRSRGHSRGRSRGHSRGRSHGRSRERC